MSNEVKVVGRIKLDDSDLNCPTISCSLTLADLDSTFHIQLYKKHNNWKPSIPKSISTKEHFFISSQLNSAHNSSNLIIYERNTFEIKQRIVSENFNGNIKSIEIEDYNFDNYDDFSIFRFFGAGPNTFRDYYLININTCEYFKIIIDGSSLIFDQDKKLVYSHNQCCAGAYQSNSTFKIVNDNLVLIKENCKEYDAEIDDYIEVECK